MKTQTLTPLCLIGVAVLATAAWYGGCQPDPCPDLHIACPDLECPDGFKVDKEGCAICECATEVVPEECSSDADCPDDHYCAFSAMPFEGEVNCLGGDEEMNCIVPELGQCLPIEQPDRCEELDEWACIESPECEPVYEELPCYFDCAVDDVDCACEEVAFVGCQTGGDECFGAWIDQNGLCRAPNDGVYPAHCCGQQECWSDVDCYWGEFCDFTYSEESRVGCGEGSEDPEVGCLVAEAGVCRPIEPECWADTDCPEGFFCDFSGYGYEDGTRPAGDGEGAPADVMWGGFCQPMPEGCEALDEMTCLDTLGCEPLYESICYPCDCVDPVDCECATEDMCEPWFVGCTDATVGECTDDADCGEGFYCELGWYGGEPVDCGADPETDCLGVGQCMPIVLDCSIHVERETCASAGCAWEACPPNAFCDVEGWCFDPDPVIFQCGADDDCGAGLACVDSVCVPA